MPEAVLVELLCDLAEGKDSDLDVVIEPDVANRALRGMVRILSSSAIPTVRVMLRARAPTLASVFPWLPTAFGSGRSGR